MRRRLGARGRPLASRGRASLGGQRDLSTAAHEMLVRALALHRLLLPHLSEHGLDLRWAASLRARALHLCAAAPTKHRLAAEEYVAAWHERVVAERAEGLWRRLWARTSPRVPG